MLYIELIGVASSAIAGAMLAMDHRADIFGVLFLAFLTAFGGGILRDMMIGSLPRMFQNGVYLLVCLTAALLIFLFACRKSDWFRQHEARIDFLMNLPDSLGLAAYTVVGVDVALAALGFSNGLAVIVLGVTTGIGGGMIRDICLGTMPILLRKRVYAVASICGAMLHFELLQAGTAYTLSAILSVGLIVGLRLLAIRYNWNLPRAHYNDPQE